MAEESYDDLLNKIKEMREKSEGLESIVRETPLDRSLKSKIFTPWEYDKRFTSKFIGLVEVPEGNAMAKLKFGRAKGFKIPIVARLSEIFGQEPSRIFNGGVKGPGIRLLFGFGGLYATAFVVDTKLRTSDYSTKAEQNLITNDGVELPSVDYSVNWQVTNALSAMTKITDYEMTLKEITEARIRRVVGSSDFDELSRIDPQEIIKCDGKEISDNRESNKKIIVEWDDINIDYNLESYGLRVQKIMLTQINIPTKLEESLSAGARATAEAKGMKTIADAQKYVAQQMTEAAMFYEEHPDGFKLAYLEAMKKVAETGKATFYNFPTFEEFIKKMSGKSS